MNLAQIKIGWIGTGVMGCAMAKHLLKAGATQMSVFNRTRSKADPLVQNGAEFKQPKQIAKECDVIFTMLGYPHDVRDMILTPATADTPDSVHGLIHLMKPGSILVDHTTSSPSLAKEISVKAESLGVSSIDAPVSGGDIGAINGQLVTMAGGPKDAFAKVLPLLQTYSKAAELLGDAGAGQHTKAANQIMIASSMVGTCEALIYGHKAGLPLDQLIDLLKGGGAGSFTLEKLGPRMLRRDFAPGFYVEHFVKDLGIALNEASQFNVMLPGASQAHQFYLAMKAQGLARNGTQGLLEVLEKINNVTVKKYS